MKQEIISDMAQDYVSRSYAEDEYPLEHRDIETDVRTAFEDGANYVLEHLCRIPWDEALKELADYADKRKEAQQ